MKVIYLTIVLSLIVNQANAWWATGHLLVARIAQTLLEKQDPDTFKKINDILAPLKESDPKDTSTENLYPFVECSVFADNIKRTFGSFQAGWHFIDTPYLDEGGKISDYNFTFDSHNVTEAMNAIKLWIQKADGYKDTYEYQQIMQNL